MTPSRDIARLLDVMAALRDKDTGCPWDKEQTFASIAPYTIEEAYEVADAIERNDLGDLRDELGDLLLQVAYHARIAEEMGAFAFGDVVEAITAKMIRRHPHVFGTPEERSRGMDERIWDQSKAAERAAKGTPRQGLLEDVPANLPGLARAVKLQRRASTVGFDWNDSKAVLAKLREEIDEIEAELDTGSQPRIADEIGDLLFAVANLARHLNIDPDAALRGTNEKFRRRFGYIESALAKVGRNPQDASLDEMETLWITSKLELP